MKVYKKSLLKNYRFWICVLVIAVVVYGKLYWEWNKIVLIFLLPVLSVWFLSVSFCSSYLRIGSDRLVIRNHVYGFWRKTYRYEDILRIYFEADTNLFTTGIYMRVVSWGNKMGCYYLDGVYTNDFAAIVKELRRQGIKVEVEPWIVRKYIEKSCTGSPDIITEEPAVESSIPAEHRPGRKIYRKSAWKHLHLVMFTLLFFSGIYYGIVYGDPFFVVTGFSLLFMMGILSVATCCFYVVIEEDRLILQNSVYWFWNKTYRYKDIVKVSFYSDSNVYRGPWFRVVTRAEKPCHYYLECVKSSDYAALVEELKVRGVIMEVAPWIEQAYIKKQGEISVRR